LCSSKNSYLLKSSLVVANFNAIVSIGTDVRKFLHLYFSNDLTGDVLYKYKYALVRFVKMNLLAHLMALNEYFICSKMAKSC
jgi:folate-binding Fe-S cluster repair protein YgfZ